MPGQSHILYVDDEYNNIVVFESSFFKYYNIYTATSAKETSYILKEKEVHVVITDQDDRNEWDGTAGSGIR